MSDHNQYTYLPIFPLEMVAYPTVGLNLHIFEQRYRDLIMHCHANGTTFGIIPVIEGKIGKVGTEMELSSIENTYPDGRMDIKTLGKRTFIIDDFRAVDAPNLYGAGNVQFIDLDTEGDYELYYTILKQVNTLYQLFDLKKPLPKHDKYLLTYSVAGQAGLNIEQEYAFLCLPSEMERQLFLVEHLNSFIPKVIELEEMRKKIAMNGHFRNLIPPSLD
jgi:ATP-dependent Lon protease